MAYSLPPLINGKSNEWADIVLNMFGQPFVTIQDIEYDNPQAMENIKGAGNKNIGRSFGNFDPTGKVTLLMEEMEQLQAAAPNGVIQAIPEFDITVYYFDPSLPPRTHTLKGCRFKNNGRKMSQGDTMIKCEIELIVGDILFV